jgi:hypothetical protein
MKYTIFILTGLLFTGCAPQVEYLEKECPYVKPLHFKLTVSPDGTLDKPNTKKAIKALRYYTKETTKLETVHNKTKLEQDKLLKK